MSNLRVVPHAAVPRTRGAEVFQILNREVVPSLRRKIGAAIILASEVVITDLVDGDGGSPEGRVPGTMDQAGYVLTVESPMVNATLPADTMRYVLAHELAHYHELMVRKKRRMGFGDRRSTELWSEYYAQRVSYMCGYVRKDLFPQRWTDYYLTWLRAECDADPTRLEGTGEPGEVIYALISWWDGLDRMFGSFPAWQPAEVQAAVVYFRGLRQLATNLYAGPSEHLGEPSDEFRRP